MEELFDLPLVKNGEYLSFAFIETGCRFAGKRNQLFRRKKVFLNRWFSYPRASALGPDIFRMVAHYTPNKSHYCDAQNRNIDAFMRYTHLPFEILLNLTSSEKEVIVKSISKTDSRELFEGCLLDMDVDKLYHLIVVSDENNIFSGARGAVAELIAQKTIESVIGDEYNQYKNQFLDCSGFDKKNVDSLEIDHVLQFYGSRKFEELLDNLSSLDYVSISRNKY